ncbi:MAG: glutathione S-transferase family protein [Colwellia sp.]|nr:glutathione S-transferase family protein [Colwellia sp.]MCW8865158.1 glutathione S-transferase family protein [Colwellia sp.]MCW9081938.1 glutathione S-transferase family protein [Colwellia sp.]
MASKTADKLKLWHCYNSRSLRVLWALEELGLDYTVETMPFPPRYTVEGYKALNSLGTVPYFIDSSDTDNEIHMTESVAICHYLGEKYQHNNEPSRLIISTTEADYGNYLNWLYHSDATLTFPQTLVLRYREFAAKDCQQAQTAEDYDNWFAARLTRLNEHLIGRDYLCENRFTMADIAIGFALHLATLLNLEHHFSPHIAAYLARLKQRPAFQRAQAIGKAFDPFSK